MKHKPAFAASVSLAALVLSTACSSDATAPSQQDAMIEVAPALAEMSGLGGGRGTPAAGVPRVNPASCLYSAFSSGFTCPPVTVNGLTITRSFSLFDAAGNPLSQFTRGAIATIRQELDISGTTSRSSANGSGSMTLRRHEVMTSSGLNGTVHTLNGTGTSSSTGTMTRNGVAAAVTSSGVDTTRNVVIAKSATGSANWPQSGTIIHAGTRTTTAAGQNAVTHTSRQQLTYNGTSTVTVQVTSDQGTKSCTRNLAVGGPLSCSP